MKRYKWATNNDPKKFRDALDYLKDTQEFTGTPDEFFKYTNVWEIIPMELFNYFEYRPYLEIMGLQGLLDKEIKRIIGKDTNKWYLYNEKYGYYVKGPGSGNNIIQILWPEGDRFGEYDLIPYDEWETNKEAIEKLSDCVVEEIPEIDIEIIPPVDGVNVI